MKKTFVKTAIITSIGVSLSLVALAAYNSASIANMQATSHTFMLTSELNAGETGLTSAPVKGKKGGDLVTAAEYNRLLELLAQRGSSLPTDCTQDESVLYQASTDSWVCESDHGGLVDLASISPTCTSTLISADEIKTVCAYTGSDQTVAAPSGYTQATVKAWGAGSSGQLYAGGAGGYTQGNISVNGGDQFAVMVGQGGDMSVNYQTLPPTYGFGGGTHYWNRAGQGGGLSGIYGGTQPILETSQSRALVIAGGGGGGDDPVQYGAPGTPGNQTSSTNTTSLGTRGTDTSVLALLGAGGGGYYGGINSEGGVGYTDSSVTGSTILTGTGVTPPNQSDPDYVSGIGVGIVETVDGTPAVADNGLVVIRWTK